MSHRIEGPNEAIIAEVKQSIAKINKDTARLDYMIAVYFRKKGVAISREVIDQAMEAEK